MRSDSKGAFILKLMQRLEDSPNLAALSKNDVESFVTAVFDLICETVGQGAAIWLRPWCKFYPKVIRRSGKTPNVKLGICSYAKTDAKLVAGYLPVWNRLMAGLSDDEAVGD